MKSLLRITILLIVIVFSSSCNKTKQNEEWKHIFDKRNVKGTFVLKNTSTGDIKIYNTERSDSTYLPASTFKILNSMIALQSGVVKST